MGLEQAAHIDRHPFPLDRPRRPHPDPRRRLGALPLVPGRRARYQPRPQVHSSSLRCLFLGLFFCRGETDSQGPDQAWLMMMFITICARD